MITIETIYEWNNCSHALQFFENKSHTTENVSWTRLRQKRRYEEQLPTIRTITNAELGSEWKVSAIRIAADYYSRSCDVHENCCESCARTIFRQAIPFIDPAVSIVELAVVTGSKKCSPPIHRDTPRDRDWLKGKNPETFRYSTINSTAEDIRVLRLKKGRFRADVVECEMVTVNLGHGQNFEALSYCWGPHDMSEVMICNGRKHAITPTLNTALKAYRESKVGEDHLLWVDAVSIDQTNQQELSQQIPLMRKVYSRASEVFVHLGHAEPDTSLGLDWMGRLAVLWAHVAQAEKFGAIAYEYTPLPEQIAVWEAYFKVFASPWFRRTWVLQEIALSQRAVLSIGRFTVPWANLEDSIAMFVYGRQHHVMLNFVMRPIPGVNEGVTGMMQMHSIRELAQSPKEDTFFEIMMATRNFEVSDPRDKIIGVLGMIGDVPAELKSLCDYRLSVSQIYHRAALYLIKTGHIREIMSHAGLQRRIERPELPSWAPDWATEISDNHERPLRLFYQALFNAGGSEGDCLIFEDEAEDYPLKLATVGLCHHKVIAVSHLDEGFPTAPKDYSSEIHRAWYKSAERCWKRADKLVYGDTEEAFARTLLVNGTWSGEKACEAFTAIDDVVAVFRTAIEEWNADPEKSFMPTTDDESARLSQTGTFLMQMKVAMQGRRLAVTDTGYLGLVPACTEVGDVIAIFFGFPTPFVIRPGTVPEAFRLKHSWMSQFPRGAIVWAQLVGDAYLHGLMQGEAVEQRGQNERFPSLIILT